MTKKEAIERLKYDISAGEYSTTKTEVLETVLNLLEKKDIDIIETKEANRQLSIELQKKDKEIDLMSEQLAGLTIWNNEIEEPLILGDKEEVKQYFERKVENEN